LFLKKKAEKRVLTLSSPGKNPGGKEKGNSTVGKEVNWGVCSKGPESRFE